MMQRLGDRLEIDRVFPDAVMPFFLDRLSVPFSVANRRGEVMPCPNERVPQGLTPSGLGPAWPREVSLVMDAS
jgi:hypothetical protein